ncbi:acyl-CoA N-acyltransferase [Acaromyces ingoldii]|uniref:Acyl-CoA N-acyltransferase n=1 Tax=Acaromyces ingoldii TaxID=215250 RepID=A0A316YL34_9BASI|nr:acyl-CoA N-acyltransferase [Acaromyces ingoldii]PWN90107.1 acyl-CoA N-acyltransferase [Acaromyces ingoldii]
MSRKAPLAVNVRPATPDDIPTLIQFIKELAIYEKEPDAAKATPELMKENLFEKKYAEALVAEDPEQGNRAVGMAIYFFSFSTWTSKPSLYLEDLFVVPNLRNRGAGKALFRALGRVAEERGCQRLDWQVLKWNA